MNIYNIQISFGLEVPDKISLNIYFSGCRNNKKCDRHLCQNKELHSFEVGSNYEEWIEKIDNILNGNLVECVCFLGGDPLDQEYADIHKIVSHLYSIKPDILIYAYTGYDYEDNKTNIDLFIDDFKIEDIFVGHYSSISNIQYWLKR